MSEIIHLPEEIKKELRIDAEGKSTASVRGAARLADVSDTAIRNGLNVSANLEVPPLAQFLIDNGFDPADLISWLSSGIPDLAIALILEYYAYECQERYRKEHGHIETTTAKHSDGTIVSYPRWFLSTVDYLAKKLQEKN